MIATLCLLLKVACGQAARMVMLVQEQTLRSVAPSREGGIRWGCADRLEGFRDLLGHEMMGMHLNSGIISQPGSGDTMWRRMSPMIGSALMVTGRTSGRSVQK